MDITMPQLGESVTEGTVTAWFKRPGDEVREDDVLFEVTTDKVDSDVPSPVSGVLTEVLVAAGDTVPIGTLVARIAVHAAAPRQSGNAEPVPDPVSVPSAGEATAVADPVRSGNRHGAPVRADRTTFLSPVVRRMLADKGLSPDAITGTGEGGRITRDDVLAAAAAPSATPEAPASVPPTSVSTTPASTTPVSTTPVSTTRAHAAPTAAAEQLHDGDLVVPFTHIRQVTADHLMRSLASTAQAIVSMQVDYGHVDEVRSNTDLTYLPFVTRAVIDALSAFPHLNATVHDDGVVLHRHVHLAIAVDLDDHGLVTPVVHGAERLRIRALADAIVDVSTRARSHRLTADDVAGGTFTITNVGKFGTSMSIPILNHPQAAILAVDGIAMRPVTVGTKGGGYGIAVRPTGNLTLTFDHRAVDGAYAAAFLARIRSILEDRSWSDEL